MTYKAKLHIKLGQAWRVSRLAFLNVCLAVAIFTVDFAVGFVGTAPKAKARFQAASG